MRLTGAMGLLPGLILLAACGGNGDGSGWNPSNWFRVGPKVEMMEAAPAVESDPRPLVAQVLSMAVEPMAGGVIVRATGLPPTQGWWEAALIPGPEEEGRLVFNFVVVPPTRPMPSSTQASREITAGAYVSDLELQGIREITVIGANGGRSSRR